MKKQAFYLFTLLSIIVPNSLTDVSHMSLTHKGNRMKRFVFGVYVLAFLIALLTSCTSNPAETETISPVDLMPGDNEVDGWIIDSNTTKCFDGVVENSDQLFELIDGPGELYVPYGFKRGAFKGYINTSNNPDSENVEACIDIFDQTTHENALEVFKVTGSIEDYEIIQIGDTARLDTNFLTSICLEMVSKNYFVRLSIYNKTDPFKEVLLNMASIIIQNINSIINTRSDVCNNQVSLSILPVKQGTILKITETSILKSTPSLSKIKKGLLFILSSPIYNKHF